MQHTAYMTDYLKEKKLERGLEKLRHRGRIWRVIPKGFKTQPAPKLSEMTTQELVELLAHPDGWYRDMAQRLLVERNDSQAVVLLEELVKSNKSALGSFHALWTLEGLGSNKHDLLLEVLRISDPWVKNSALRQLEGFAQNDPEVLEQVEKEMIRLYLDAPEELALQLALSAYVISQETRMEVIQSVLEAYGHLPLIRDAAMSSLGGIEWTFL